MAGAVATGDPSSPSPLAEGRALLADFVAFGGRRLGAAVALMIAGGVLEGVGLALLLPIFTLLAPEAGGRWHAVVVDTLTTVGLRSRAAQLGGVLAAFCALVAVRAAVLATRDRLLSDLSLGFVDHQRLKVIGDLAHARWSALARLRHARVAHVLSSEVTRLAFACATMMQIAVSAIILGVQVALMLVLSPLVTALAGAFALAGLLAIVPLSRRAATVGRSTTRFAFRIAGEAAHFLGGVKIAVAHDMADTFVARIADESARMRAEQEAQQRFQSRVAIASTSIASLIGAALVFGAVLLRVPTVTLLAALVVLSRMNGPVRMLQQSAQQLFGVLPAFAALGNLRADLGEPAPVARHDAARTVPAGPIRFEGVTFGYPDAPAPVLDGLTIAIAPGELVGLAGPSGTGKTTFVDLLTGLLTPTAGRITVGGIALDADTIGAWRRRLAYVAQDSFLINDSIRLNLTWGGAPRPDAALWHALAQAGAAELVAAMPDGLDTVADERGTRLSGGERQRIALARALLRDPALLILDEGTNAIDVATEGRVIANLRASLPVTTMIVIAHREETLRACDRVLSLAREEGQVKRPTSASAGSTG